MDRMNPAELFVPEIRQLLQQRQWKELKTLLSVINPIELADAFIDFQPREQIVLLRLLDSKRALVVFEELDVFQQEFILHHVGEDSLKDVLGDLPEPERRGLFRTFPETILRKMEKQLRQGQRVTLAKSGSYSPNSVGYLMDRQVVAIKPDMTAREAIDFLRSQLRVRDDHRVDAFYVTNESGQPVGALTPRTLLAAPADSRISDLMMSVGSIRLPAAMDIEGGASLFTRYRLTTAPVVNEEGRLVGTVSASDMLRVLQEEATEDIQKLGASEALDEPYFKISFLRMIRRRGTWLCVLFLGEMLTATAMAFFEKEIARAVVLALFIPLIISSGGNSGSQAATLIVRAMALQEIRFKDWWRVMRREFAAGLTLGLILGCIGFLRIYIWSLISPLYGPHYLLVALTVGLALVLVVLWGSLTGSLLPMVLRRLGLDPAVVSAPFVATLVDVTGLVIYFVTGMLILRGTLL